jgi:hypothetical protein
MRGWSNLRTFENNLESQKRPRLKQAEITGNHTEIRSGLVLLFADCLEENQTSR